MISREQVRAALTGPIASLRTPFARDGAIDYESLRRMVDFDLAAESRALLLTYGDSLYSVLSDQDVAEVTRAVVEHVRGRALVVAADRGWWTGQAVEFARLVRDVGADVLMLLPPNWGGSITPQTIVDHFAAVGRHMPLMVVTGFLLPYGASFGLRTIEALRDQVEAVVAVKDDFLGEFARKMCLAVSGRWAVFSGGLKQNHLDLHPYGCDGYLSSFITFQPAIAQRYWTAIRGNDLAAAREVIARYDMPLFDFVQTLPGQFDAGFHGLAEIYGLAGRWRRPPYHSLSDADMDRLRTFVQQLGLL